MGYLRMDWHSYNGKLLYLFETNIIIPYMVGYGY